MLIVVVRARALAV